MHMNPIPNFHHFLLIVDTLYRLLELGPQGLVQYLHLQKLALHPQQLVHELHYSLFTAKPYQFV